MEANPGDMHVVAAGFVLIEEARAAVAELRAMLEVAATDISVREVGGTHEFVNGFHVVLAGRIREGVLAKVRAVFVRHAGEVLTDVPEAWAWSKAHLEASKYPRR
jgi:hypothetical protein